MTSCERVTLEGVLAAFDEHLRRTRSVCPGTRRNYARFVRAFLQSGTDLAAIALWLGHSSPAVTHQYLETDLATKEAVLQRCDTPKITSHH